MAQDPELNAPAAADAAAPPAAEEAPAAESAEAAEPAGPQPLDPPHLMAAVAESMVLSGLGNKADLVETFLMGAMSRFVQQGTVDLGLLWNTLVREMFQPREKTAQTMLLTAIYIAKTFQVPVAVPQEAQELMESLLPSEEERASAGERLAAAVDRRLNRHQIERSGAAAALAASGAALAASGSAQAVSTSGKGGAKALAKAGKTQETPKVADLLKPETRKKAKRASINLNDPRIAAVLGIVFLALAGYWVNELVVKEVQLNRKRQEFYAKRSIELDKLPAGLAIKEAFVVAAVLKVHLADDKLALLPEKQRAQFAADMLASLETFNAMRLALFSDAKRYLVRKDGEGVVTVQVLNSD